MSNNATSTDIDSHISKKYDIRRRLGKGAYGVVWKATDRRSGTVVAVKKIFDAFRNRTDAQRTFREIVFLKEFGSHPNIIQLLNVHRASNDKDLYLVFEFMETDLHHVIKKGNILKGIHRQYIMYQLFKATQFLHSGNVIHRDQKPSNILLDSQCNCKLADFGLARSLSIKEISEATEGDACLTDYVATRWYRAPELLVGDTQYGPKVDVWAIGCVFVELVKGEALWPGKSDVDQLYLIRRNLGDLIPRHMQIFKSNEFFCGLSIPDPGTIEPVEKKLPRSLAGEEGVDFMKKCLDKDPAKRYSCEQLLSHGFFKNFTFKFPESELEDFERLRRNVSYNGSLLPHLPGGSQQGSPDMRLAASNLSLGSHNGNGGNAGNGKGNNKYDNHPHHLPTI